MTKPKVRAQEYRTVATDSLIPSEENPRRSNMHVIKGSIAENGFYGAVIAQLGTNKIIAGEHRWRAAKGEGLTEIPVIFVECTEEERQRLLVVDNRASDLADHDDVKLDRLLEQLALTRKGLLGTGFGPQNLRPTSEKTEGDPRYSTVKSWEAGPLKINAIFSFSAPIELQAKIRGILREHFPGVDFHEHVTRFDGGKEEKEVASK